MTDRIPTACETCGVDHDPDHLPTDGVCLAQGCGGRLVVQHERLDLLPVLLGGLSLMACELARKAYLQEVAIPWIPCSLVAASLALAGLSVGWVRPRTRLTWSFRAVCLLGLGMAYPPAVVPALGVFFVAVVVPSALGRRRLQAGPAS